MTALKIVVFVALCAVAYAAPSPGFFGKHEHHTIHVPYKVHTIHHHHTQKIIKEVPVVKTVHVPVYKEVHVPVYKEVPVPVHHVHREEVHVPIHHHHEHHDHHDEHAHIDAHDLHDVHDYKGWSSHGWL
ncbi:uncharacterized histidine-rich protein DDB_G0274557 [Scaptodrosophila lebanonensis]|uniref:Uncharacterized histidine-rich protein DDB_G0274557 n=1 Tax=Drosophila lebanonensis TaxID=7225 RepID=A0A6J2TZL3_DROLE|nr:uncharacterized histidine-rich protein DDB_G0274557 [Scaptodrosophila lebanonensis]